ncbi:hypothetical protein [Microbulbifer sp.]|uniref:hypothetical protein n=1 Tax=Microbulbifer sp. TaxID=1908541 RepID=UPI003F301B2C
MRYEITIEQAITVPMLVKANSEAEALAIAARRLNDELTATPEAVGDPTAEPPRIRSARKLGD